MSDALYRINDALTALMHELGVKFVHEEEGDAALNDATLAVAEAFGLVRERVEKAPMGGSRRPACACIETSRHAGEGGLPGSLCLCRQPTKDGVCYECRGGVHKFTATDY